LQLLLALALTVVVLLLCAVCRLLSAAAVVAVLEVGNGALTLAEQRSHFALWAAMKSPLIIGSDVRALAAESLAILKTKALIEVNQDDLGIQATLRAATGALNGAHSKSGGLSSRDRAGTLVLANEVAGQEASPWMTHCSFGTAVAAQQWAIVDGKFLQQQAAADNGQQCLARTTSGGIIATKCDQSSLQQWDFGRVNETVWQIREIGAGALGRSSSNGSSSGGGSSLCLSFNSTALHMEPCRKEAGDKTTPKDCAEENCRFSSLIYQQWYLNSLKQLTSAITNIPNGGSTLLPTLPNFPTNTPWCLATSAYTAPPPPPAPPDVDTSLPLQVWAGPLSGGDTVVVLLNTGNGTSTITAHWADIGLKKGASMKAVDLWTGKSKGVEADSSVSAPVASHDCAVFRLSPA